MKALDNKTNQELLRELEKNQRKNLHLQMVI